VPCIFIGYPFAKKGYKLYNLSTNSVFVSRNVIFHETVFPFASNLINPKANGCFKPYIHSDSVNIDHSILVNDIQTPNLSFQNDIQCPNNSPTAVNSPTDLHS
jgi:hypothetical protein